MNFTRLIHLQEIEVIDTMYLIIPNQVPCKDMASATSA